MTTTARVGLDCKAYRNAGTHGSPTWTAMTGLRDVALNLDKASGSAKSRGSRWDLKLPSLKSASLELELLGDTSLSEYDVLRDAYINDTVLDIAVSEGTITTTGNEYFRADFGVFKFPRNEPLDKEVTIAVGLEIVYSSNAPAFVTVT